MGVDSDNNELVTVKDYENYAKEKLEKKVYDFIAGGAGREWAVRNNEESMHAYQIVPRICEQVNVVDTSCQVFGASLSMPIMLGPCAFQKLAFEEGELATAKAAAELKTVMALSTMSSYTIEEVAEVSGFPKWFQLYVYKDRKLTKKLIKRAETAGYVALVVTIDVSVMGVRYRDIKNKFCLPKGVDAANLREINLSLSEKTDTSKIKEQTDLQFDCVTWDTIDWIASITKLPIILKGVLNPYQIDDILKRKIAGIIVSNHGGRQLESAIAPIDALPYIAHVVQSKLPIFIDGGFRSGEDVFKALALGAEAVLIARPIYCGLAVGGEKTLTACMRIMHDELVNKMKRTGCPTLAAIKKYGQQLLAKNSVPMQWTMPTPQKTEVKEDASSSPKWLRFNR
jgi:isopentenyl diphosphate isomerase/L-lactate dehydrogenase-like FMN-dependent dehydrogenase